MTTPNEWFHINPNTSTFLSANLTVLRKRFPSAADVAQNAIETVKAYEFNQVDDKSYACRFTQNGQTIELYPPQWFSKDIEVGFRRIQDAINRGAQLMLIAGSGMGYWNADTADCLEEKKQTSVVCIENRPEIMLAQMCLFDCRPIFENPDFHFIVGKDFIPQLNQVFEDQALFQTDRNRIISFPERVLTQDETAQYQPLNQWFAQQQNAYLNTMQQNRILYEQKISQPANLETGTVWTATLLDAYAHAPLLRALNSGFSGHGMTPVFFPLQKCRNSNDRITNSLLQHCPDVYLFLHLASKRVIPENIHRPRAIWYLDHPKHFEWDDNRTQFYENDFIFYSDRRYAPYFKQTKAGGAFHLTVCPSLNRKGEYREEYAAPVMFVGSHNPVNSMTQNLSPSTKDHVFHIVDELLDDPSQSVVSVSQQLNLPDRSMFMIQSIAEAFTSTIQREFPTPNDKLEYFFYAFTNSFKRERFIKALLDLGLVIYGPDSWLEVLGEKHSGQFRGWLDNADLADAYASAKVCINIHSIQCPTCLNSRDFDVLRAGGCLVSDEVEDLHAGYLQPGEDLWMYQSPDELVEVVNTLLEDEDKRQCIQSQGHQTVMQRHLPEHRAKEILDAIRSSGWR